MRGVRRRVRGERRLLQRLRASAGAAAEAPPAVVNVRVVNSFWDGCVGCFSWAVGIVVILALVGWIFSC